MTYNLYFSDVRTGNVADEPVAWRIDTLVHARETAIAILRKARHTSIAIYMMANGNEIYQGYVRYDGDAYFYYAVSGKKWRIGTDGKIVKLRKNPKTEYGIKGKLRPFGL